MDDAAVTGRATSAQLAMLMTWLSPSYPVGAFSYSHGIEWAVEAGDIACAGDLEDWLRTILRHGAGWSDAVIVALVWRAVDAGSDADWRAHAELSAAFQPSAERSLETSAQGRAFVEITARTWPSARFQRLCAEAETTVTYPVAVATAAAGHGISLRPVLIAYLHAFVANLVSAGVRLVPLGQSDGQKVLAALFADIETVVEEAIAATPDDIGGAALRSDIASMKHETQYTRLFRS